MNFLKSIIEYKIEEVAQQQKEEPLVELRARAAQRGRPVGFAFALVSSAPPPIIAEVKRASPSLGIIRKDLDPVETAISYWASGAAAVSVLTDQKFFQGELRFLEDIKLAVEKNLAKGQLPPLPLLRKDFIIDSYQIWQSRAYGADAVLLIAACLTAEQIHTLLLEAQEAELDVLLEIHNQQEMEIALDVLKQVLEIQAISGTQTLIGINARDLATFKVDFKGSKILIKKLSEQLEHKGSRSQVVIVAESGISDKQQMIALGECGADAFLIGEALVRSGAPGENLAALIADYRTTEGIKQ